MKDRHIYIHILSRNKDSIYLSSSLVYHSPLYNMCAQLDTFTNNTRVDIDLFAIALDSFCNAEQYFCLYSEKFEANKIMLSAVSSDCLDNVNKF